VPSIGKQLSGWQLPGINHFHEYRLPYFLQPANSVPSSIGYSVVDNDSCLRLSDQFAVGEKTGMTASTSVLLDVNDRYPTLRGETFSQPVHSTSPARQHYGCLETGLQNRRHNYRTVGDASRPRDQQFHAYTFQDLVD
jgi:hypothetical protein